MVVRRSKNQVDKLPASTKFRQKALREYFDNTHRSLLRLQLEPTETETGNQANLQQAMKRVLMQQGTVTMQTRFWLTALNATQYIASNQQSKVFNANKARQDDQIKSSAIMCQAHDEVAKWQDIARNTSNKYRISVAETSGYRKKCGRILALASRSSSKYTARGFALRACEVSAAEMEKAIVVETSTNYAAVIRRLGLPRCVATGVRQKLLHKRQESHLLDQSLSMLKFELLRKGVCQIKHDRIALENNRCYQDKVCEEHQSMKKCTLATKINTVQNMKETPSAHILDDVQSNAITSTTASPIPEISSHKMHHKCHNSALDSETDHKLAKERNRLAMYCMFLQHQMNAIAVADILWRQQLSLEGCSPAQTSLVAQQLADHRHLQDKTIKTSSSLQSFRKNASMETCKQQNSWRHFTANREDGVSDNLLCAVEELDWKNFLTHKLIGLKLAEILRVLNQTKKMSNIEVKPPSQEATFRYIQAVCYHSTQLGGTHLLRINLSALRLKDHVIIDILRKLGAYIASEGHPLCIPPWPKPGDLLSHLVLCNNSLGDIAASLLASKLLPISPVLVLLDLRQNCISACGGHMLNVGLNSNKTILASSRFDMQLDEDAQDENGLIVIGWRDKGRCSSHEILTELTELYRSCEYNRQSRLEGDSRVKILNLKSQNSQFVRPGSLRSSHLLIDLRSNY